MPPDGARAGDPPAPDPGQLADARHLLAGARLLVLTGAGVSAESGVPTFRGAGGLWRDHRAESLATPAAFARDPRLVWEWYAWRRALVRECAPNAAHVAIARMLLARPAAVLATQNVDGLHGRALRELAPGPRALADASARLLELHGSLFRLRCSACAHAADDDGEVDTSSRGALPHCPHCGALVRPGVVWFGEPLDPAVLGAACRAAEAAEACLVVGTSAVVQPAAGIALLTHRAGGRLVEVNPEPTSLSAAADVAIRAPAAAVVPGLLA